MSEHRLLHEFPTFFPTLPPECKAAEPISGYVMTTATAHQIEEAAPAPLYLIRLGLCYLPRHTLPVVLVPLSLGLSEFPT